MTREREEEEIDQQSGLDLRLAVMRSPRRRGSIRPTVRPDPSPFPPEPQPNPFPPPNPTPDPLCRTRCIPQSSRRFRN